MKVEAQKPGVETRLKKKQRGFYFDASPSFAGVRESHDHAAAHAGEKKLAAEAGVIAALEKFGLSREKGHDPVRAMSEMFKYEDFGLPVKGDPAKLNRPEKVERILRPRQFSGAAPPGSSGGAMEFSSAHHPDNAQSYGGV